MKGIKEYKEGAFFRYINEEVKTPDLFLQAHPDNMHEKLKKWSETAKVSDSLYLHGPVGTGKTHGLYALAKLCRANGLTVKIINLTDTLEYLKSLFDQASYRSEEVFKELFVKPQILIIDELGAEKTSEWSLSIIYRIVNKRYELGRYGTYFASNLTPEELGKTYSDRVASRIIGMCRDENEKNKGVIKLDGVDRRLNKK